MGTFLESNLLFIFLILMLIGASAKSAQLGLHGWLANAMEGRLDNIYYLNTFFTTIFSPFYYIISNYKDTNPGIPLPVLNQKGKDLPELTPYQREAVIGLLLGDGHISKSSKR